MTQKKSLSASDVQTGFLPWSESSGKGLPDQSVQLFGVGLGGHMHALHMPRAVHIKAVLFTLIAFI